MTNEWPAPVPIAVVEIVDQFIGDEHRDARKFTNRELLDDSGAYRLHLTAAEVYARGYQDGRMAEMARASGERQRERDRIREQPHEPTVQDHQNRSTT